MLSHRLSKILSEKNVPHEGDRWWFSKHTMSIDEDLQPKESRFVGYVLLPNNGGSDESIPAYPEITLFKYAKVVFGERGQYAPDTQDWDYDTNPNPPDDEYFGSPVYQIHTHTLADLFSSGASEQEIENYVLESLG